LKNVSAVRTSSANKFSKNRRYGKNDFIEKYRYLCPVPSCARCPLGRVEGMKEGRKEGRKESAVKWSKVKEDSKVKRRKGLK
jgi:hypothetical protein